MGNRKPLPHGCYPPEKFDPFRGRVKFSLQCFDTVGWRQEGHPPCKKLGVGLLVVTFDWRFARLIAAVVSPAPSPLAPIKSRRWILSGTG